MCPGRDEKEEEERESVCVGGVNHNKTLRYICFAICKSSLHHPLLSSISLSILPHPLPKSTGDLGSS